MQKTRRRWEDHEDEQLKELWANEYTANEIASVLNRTPKAVSARVHLLRVAGECGFNYRVACSHTLKQKRRRGVKLCE